MQPHPLIPTLSPQQGSCWMEREHKMHCSGHNALIEVDLLKQKRGGPQAQRTSLAAVVLELDFSSAVAVGAAAGASKSRIEIVSAWRTGGV
jgi:hypothetical protein